MDEENLAKSYAATLAYNFPESNFYLKSYNLINNIEIEKNKDNWFNQFNPIRIITKDLSENVEIQRID